MRLRRLDLTRYGKFTDFSVDFGERVEGQPDLHIVYGPNESGKSTALSAFLDLLFGIEHLSKYGFLHSYATMRVGGCLELSAGPRDLIRIKKPSPTLRDMSNEPLGEGIIAGDLGGLDRDTYRTMFSLDDETLEAGGNAILASNGELGQLLFSASAGLSDLSKTLTQLRSTTENFARPNWRGGEFQQLKSDLLTLKHEKEAIDTLASDYNRLATARDAARSRYNTALAERTDVQAKLAQVNRLLAALPKAREIDKLHERLEGLADLPEPPAGWYNELPELSQKESIHRSQKELAAAETKRLSSEIEKIEPDPIALRLVSRLERLTELRGRHDTAEIDLPERMRELAREDGEVASILTRLERNGVQEASSLLLSAAQSARFDSLVVRRSGIETKSAVAFEELSQAENDLKEARRALDDTPGCKSVISLAAVTSALAEMHDSDHRVRLRSAQRAQTGYRDLLAKQLAVLTPWTGSAEELADLIMPARSTVEIWRTEIQRYDDLVTHRYERLEQIRADVDMRTAEVAAIGSTAGLLNDQSAAEIRRSREAAWAEHRRVLDQTTADAFEIALRHDDIVSNARFGHERDLAKLHEQDRALAVKRAEADRTSILLEEATAERQRHAQIVADAISEISPVMIVEWSPAQLLTWMSLRDKALETLALLDQTARDIHEAETDSSQINDKLRDAMSRAEVPFEPSAGPADLAIEAQTAVDRSVQIQTLRQVVSACERDVRRRELAVQKAAIADENWRTSWSEACAGCWLGEEATTLPFEIVREMLSAAARLDPLIKSRAILADRIRGMEEDQATFGHEVKGMVDALDIDPGERSWPILAQEVLDRIQEARAASISLDRLQTAFSAAQERQRQVDGEALIHERRVGEMTELMQASSVLDLVKKLGDAEKKADIQSQIARCERDVITGLDVKSLDDARVLLAPHDASELEIERARLSTSLENLDITTRELFAATKQAEDRIAAVGGDDAAAVLDERRRTKLLAIEDEARRHLRLRAGIAAAERALRVYRDQHRSTMMTWASEAFRTISRGAYRGLSSEPGRNGDVLVALGAENGSKLATELSKGARFQLYLALRAAGYREFEKQRTSVPFIADDIMETFDDFRAEETLRVFEGMARIGQVIYLTHHDHLVAIANRTVPGVRIHRLV
jgi:uncharacterized protein YhaN